MSGGVDSSVAATLLVEQVGLRFTYFVSAQISTRRILIYPPFSCETGTVAMKRVQMMAVNGKEIGKTSSASAVSSAFLAKWSIRVNSFMRWYTDGL